MKLPSDGAISRFPATQRALKIDFWEHWTRPWSLKLCVSVRALSRIGVNHVEATRSTCTTEGLRLEVMVAPLRKRGVPSSFQVFF